MRTKTKTDKNLRRWAVSEQIRTPDGITESNLSTHFTKWAARRAMYANANLTVKYNPRLILHPSMRVDELPIIAKGIVETDRDEIRIKVDSDYGYHHRILRLQHL